MEQWAAAAVLLACQPGLLAFWHELYAIFIAVATCMIVALVLYLAAVGAAVFHIAPVCAAWLNGCRPWNFARKFYRRRGRIQYLMWNHWPSRCTCVRILSIWWLMSYTRRGEGALSAAVLSALVSVLGFFDVHLDTWCRPFSVFAAFCIAYDLMPWWAVSVCASTELVCPT